jgi:leucyl-tRNA synthetase
MVNDAVGKKQSKSLGNVVEPFVVIEKYGADALRLYLMFTTSYDAPINWDDEGPKDARAYLNRVWRLMDRLEEPLRQHRALLPDSRLCTEEPARSLLATVHRTIEKVGRDIEHFQFNTAIAALMTLTNEISVYPEDAHSQPVAAAYRALVRMLGLFAPVVCEEIWSRIADDGLLVRQPWPVFDPEAIVSSTKEIAVQVNGKFILSIVVPQEAGDDRILETALNVPRVADRLSGKVIRKTIHVPNRLVNIVAS